MAVDVSANGETSRPLADGLIADRAYHDLRERIVTLRLPPGSILHEETLMAELGIGRTPLREATKRLSLEGLVAIRPRRATYVTEVETADIVQIAEVRAELEGFAAELAARRMDAAARRAVGALAEEIEALGRDDDHEALMDLDRRIHGFVWSACGNPYLVDTLERYFSLSLRVWYLVLDRVPGLGHSVHDQDEMLRALSRRDGARARALMHEHVLEFQREIVAAFNRG